MGRAVVSPLARRSVAEQDAYMAGQRAALKLAAEKGVEYAWRVIELSQRGILERRDEHASETA